LIIRVSRGKSSGHPFRAMSHQPSRALVEFVPSDYTSDEARLMLTIFAEENANLPKNAVIQSISGPC
jgi:hypothetical protein